MERKDIIFHFEVIHWLKLELHNIGQDRIQEMINQMKPSGTAEYKLKESKEVEY